jgi:guanine deaminase
MWHIPIDSVRTDDAAAPFDAWLAHEARTDY